MLSSNDKIEALQAALAATLQDLAEARKGAERAWAALMSEKRKPARLRSLYGAPDISTSTTFTWGK